MRHKDYPAVVFLVLLVVIFFWDSIFAGKIFCMRDMFFDYVPWRDFARQAVSEGHFPLWNPCSSFGQPFMAEPQTAILYPLSLFHYILSMKWAFKIGLISHLLIAVGTMYFLMRRWKFDAVPSMLAAICFSFNTYMIAQMEYAIFTTACWTPLALLTTVLLMEKVRQSDDANGYSYVLLFIPQICFLTVVLSVQFLSGYIQVFFYTLIILFIYIVVNSLLLKNIRLFIHSILLFILSCVFTLGIVMVQVLLTWENITMSIRSARFDPGLHMASLHPLYLISSIAPFLFGRPGYLNQWLSNLTVFEFWLGTFYIGILPLIIMSFLPFLKHQKDNSSEKQTFMVILIFCLVTVFLGLIMSLGKYTPVYGIFFKYVPLFNILRWPSKFLFLVVFALSILTGSGYQKLQDSIASKKLDKKSLIPLVFWILLFAILCLMCLYPDVYIRNISLLFSVPKPIQNLFASNAVNELHFSALFTGLSIAAIAFLIFSKSSSSWLAHMLIIVVVFINLSLVGRQIHYVADDDIYDRKPPIARSEIFSNSNYRVHSQYSDDIQQFMYGSRNRANFEWARMASVGESCLHFRYDKTSGGGTLKLLYPRNVYQLMMNQPPEYANKLADMLSIKYVITGPPFDKILWGDTSKKIGIVTRSTYLPRAIIVNQIHNHNDFESAMGHILSKEFNPAQEAIVDMPWSEYVDTLSRIKGASSRSGTEEPAGRLKDIAYGWNRIHLRVQVSQSGLLVLNEAWYPGWKVLIDSVEKPLIRANSIFMGVFVEPGAEKIEFIYDPWIFKAGMFVSIISLFILIGSWIFCFKNRVLTTQ